jgi:hypothetical protein
MRAAGAYVAGPPQSSLQYLATGPVAASLRTLKIRGLGPFNEAQAVATLAWFPMLREVELGVWPERGMSKQQEEGWRAGAGARVFGTRGLSVSSPRWWCRLRGGRALPGAGVVDRLL